MLPLSDFKKIIKLTPLISIDLIVRNPDGKILLGKRLNKPAQGFWFVPGGRVLKEETLEDAFERLIKEELNSNLISSKFKGVYQHFYDDNVTGEPFGTHYIVLAYEIILDCDLGALPTEQHLNYKWFEEKDLLLDKSIHIHSKWYFQTAKEADCTFC
jgi:colanic acid biosynthesis protein WcaH